MSLPNKKIHNNSYESSESSITSTCSDSTNADKSLNFLDKHQLPTLAALLLPPQLDVSLCENDNDGIYRKEIVLSSQGSDFTGLVETNKNRNVHQFSELHTYPSDLLDISAHEGYASSDMSYEIPNQNQIIVRKNSSERLLENLDLADTKATFFLESEDTNAVTIDNKIISLSFTNTEEIHTGTGLLVSEDSCNAVDNKLSNEQVDNTSSQNVEELSFNGKIDSLPPLVASQSFQEKTVSSYALNFQQTDINGGALKKFATANVMYTNERSPDIFASDDESDNDEKETDKSNDGRLYVVEEETEEEDTSFINKSNPEIENEILTEERVQLKRINASLSGVLPPPSVTHMQLDLKQILRLYKNNSQQNAMLENPFNFGDVVRKEIVLSKPKHTIDEIMSMDWPTVSKAKTHGISYNRSTTTERIESLSLKYIDRYVSSDTMSSFATTQSPSSSRKRNLRKQQLRQSPGNRLSHLAKRRAIFSSANLLKTTQSVSSSALQSHPSKLCNRQILLNSKKTNITGKRKGKTPKRRTPGRKSPGKKSPKSLKKRRGSSQKKQQPAPAAPTVTLLTRETSKRALFQSPAKETLRSSQITRPMFRSAEVASRAERSKRCLFSPTTTGKRDVVHSRFGSMIELNNLNNCTRSQPSHINYSSVSMSNLYRSDSDVSISAKRARCTENDEANLGQPKYPRLDSSTDDEKLTPNSLKFARSQSFCLGANSGTAAAAAAANVRCSMFRTNSEMMYPTSQQPQYRPQSQLQLTENHRKKLLWAVSQALQNKKIDVKHEKFKEYASVLARVTKRLFLESNASGGCNGGSTSEKMLRLTTNHVFAVMQGRSVDEIYLAEKLRIEKLNLNKNTKLQGYIAPNEYERRQKNLILKQRTMSTTSTASDHSSSIFISENSFDSSSSMLYNTGSQHGIGQSQYFSQSTEYLNELANMENSKSSQNSRLPLLTSLETATVVQQQSRLTNSSSKNNEQGTALRENFDADQRQPKSNQKNANNFAFSGKDQKNVSPYNLMKSNSAQRLLVGGGGSNSNGNMNMLKAKRQISFDS